MPAMRSSVIRSVGLILAAAGVVCGAVAIAAPSVAAAPPSDANGYIDSTARCAAAAVVFGSTASSRVAVCRGGDGTYQYRGVRVSDGAKLILPATAGGDGSFVAKQDGVTYTVTASDLVVKAGSTVLRDEPMVDFHGSTPAGQSAKAPAANAAPSSTPTSTAPVKPLPAEVGGSAASG